MDDQERSLSSIRDSQEAQPKSGQCPQWTSHHTAAWSSPVLRSKYPEPFRRPLVRMQQPIESCGNDQLHFSLHRPSALPSSDPEQPM